MNKQFISTGFDPIKGAEIMSLIGVDPNTMTIPRYQAQIQSIVKHFNNKPNARKEILNVLNGKQGQKLDILWTYVELQKEKQVTLNKLNPEDFEKDVAAEIASGHVTKPKRDLLKQQLAELKKKQHNDRVNAKKESEAVNAAFDEKKVDVYADAFKTLDSLESQLAKY